MAKDGKLLDENNHDQVLTEDSEIIVNFLNSEEVKAIK